MDPNPKTFPILSYVMSRLNSISRPSQPGADADHDIEQPQIQDRSSPRSPNFSVELVERMPHLADPSVLAAMNSAVSEVAQTRSVLQTLGDRPDHESVDLAKARIVQIDQDLSKTLEEIVCAPRLADADARNWREAQADREKECRAKAEREKLPYKAVVQLDEMHEAYENLLKEAEEKLLRIYNGHDHHSEGKEVEVGAEEEGAGEQVNEEVIEILQEASVKCVERVELSGRQLRFLPEAFGRVRGLVSLNVSDNQLEVIPDSIAWLENLEELRVSSNLLVSLPDSIGLLLNLKILDVSGNKLKALPDSISKCRSLVELDASYNDLTYLPTNIGYELVNLQKLCVHLNKLRSLPTSVCEMRSLRFLDAHFNELRGVPYAIGKLSNLESLNLSSNFSDLQELPPTFGDLINLRELDLSNNQIRALPDTFGRLEELTKLNLDQNPLYVPPMEVVNQGVEAVKEYMTKRWLDILLEEQQKNQLQVESPTRAGWLTRSTSMLGSLVTGFTEYLGVGDKSPRDPILDQNL